MKKNIPSSEQLRNLTKNHHVMHSKANIDRYEKNGLTLCILLEQQDLKLVREWKEASLKQK